MRFIRTRSRASIGALIALTLLAACSRSETPKTQDRARSSAARAEPSKFVVVEAVGSGEQALRSALPGRLDFRPQGLAAIGSPLSGRVLSVDVRPGETVAAGASVLTLQSTEVAAARAAAAQAQARLAAAEDALRRQTELLERGVGIEAERFAAQTQVKEQRAEAERAQRVLALIGSGDADRFRIRTPVGGNVLKVNVGAGSSVTPGGEALVEVGDPKRLWTVIDMAESDLAGLAIGRAAEVIIPALDARLMATVDGMGSRVDGEQRRVPVYLAVKSLPAGAIPGMLTEVRFAEAAGERISLPPSAVLIKDGSQRLVYIEKAPGKYEPRPVRVGPTRDGRVTILEGLKTGERVVVRGALLLDGEAELAL